MISKPKKVKIIKMPNIRCNHDYAGKVIEMEEVANKSKLTKSIQC